MLLRFFIPFLFLSFANATLPSWKQIFIREPSKEIENILYYLYPNKKEEKVEPLLQRLKPFKKNVQPEDEIKHIMGLAISEESYYKAILRLAHNITNRSLDENMDAPRHYLDYSKLEQKAALQFSSSMKQFTGASNYWAARGYFYEAKTAYAHFIASAAIVELQKSLLLHVEQNLIPAEQAHNLLMALNRVLYDFNLQREINARYSDRNSIVENIKIKFSAIILGHEIEKSEELLKTITKFNSDLQQKMSEKISSSIQQCAQQF